MARATTPLIKTTNSLKADISVILMSNEDVGCRAGILSIKSRTQKRGQFQSMDKLPSRENCKANVLLFMS